MDTKAVFIDGTHIKASANKKKNQKVDVAAPAKKYQELLDAEIDADSAAHGKKPLKEKDNDDDIPPTKTITESTTGPECGLFHKGEHEKQFAYVSNTACDRHGFVLDFEIIPANLHDSTTFDGLYERVAANHPETDAVAIDSAYKTPYIMKMIFDSGKIPCVPYKCPQTTDGFFKLYEYAYDEFYDCYVCTQNQVLKYSTTNRDGYREYKINSKICKDFPSLEYCTLGKTHQKTITRHVWQECMEEADHYRYVPEYRDIYKEHKETIECVFANAKENHGMRYTRMRGLQKVKMQVTLTFACMNLKKLAMWKRKNPTHNPLFTYICQIFFRLTTYCKNDTPCAA